MFLSLSTNIIFLTDIFFHSQKMQKYVLPDLRILYLSGEFFTLFAKGENSFSKSFIASLMSLLLFDNFFGKNFANIWGNFMTTFQKHSIQLEVANDNGREH
jgi:hypothetical protein